MKRIIIFSHYLGALKYFDKLYDKLTEEGHEIIYGFWRDDKYLKSMIKYCQENNRKYYALHYKIDFFVYKYIYRNSVKKMLDTLKPDLIIQTNDMYFFQNEIVNQAKKRNISTLVIQWAFTGPERIYIDSKNRNKPSNEKDGEKIKAKLKKIIISKNKIFNKFLRLEYNNKLSIAQGDSDRVSVINEYSRDLLIKQGVDKEKIVITGHLDFDNKSEGGENLKGIKNEKTKILYISQPFYGKDLERITLNQQIEYIKKIYNYVDTLFDKYCFYIKLHPAEDKKDYYQLRKMKNLRIKTNFDSEIQIINADLVISSHSTLLMSAISFKKPIITLNILKIPESESGLKRMGIDDNIIYDWKELEKALRAFIKNPKKYIRKPNQYLLVTDGKCKKRMIGLITEMMKK